MNSSSDTHQRADFATRVFGSHEFFRLWVAQFITSIGDWIGLLAITITAARVWGDNSGTAIGLVIGARVVPSLFLGQIGGVLADRWNRYRVMVVCDLGRAVLFAVLPFVDTLLQLVLVSLIIEGFTMLWIPAKEALVPTLLPQEQLAKANSLSAFATYGTFPLASGMLFGLTWAASSLEDVPGLNWLRIDEESLGFYGNALTFLAAVIVISSLAHMTTGEFPFARSHLKKASKAGKVQADAWGNGGDSDLGESLAAQQETIEDKLAAQTEAETAAQAEAESAAQTDTESAQAEIAAQAETESANPADIASLMPSSAAERQSTKGGFASGIREFAEGWRFIAFTPVVRAVNFGLATALIGGGLLIPLGVVYVEEILNAGATGYVGVQIALGSGVGLGVLFVSLLTRFISTSLGRLELFMLAVAGACVSLLLAATFSFWVGVIIGVGALGVCAGFVYVLGFTILQIEVSDDLRGRVFSALYSLVRLCLVLSLVFGALLSDLLEALVVDEVSIFGRSLALPGVRLTLWLGGLIIGGAAFFIYRIVVAERNRLKVKSVLPNKSQP